MALSEKAKKVMIASFANKSVGTEVAAAIDAGGNAQAAAVAAIPASTNLPVAAPVAAALADPLAAADVNAALDDKADNDDVEAIRVLVESRLDTLEAKVNAVIAALKAAGLMAL